MNLILYIPWAILYLVFYVAGRVFALAFDTLRSSPVRVFTVLAFLLGFPVPVWFILTFVLLSLISFALATPWSF
jgi:hypothetical protein